MSYCEKPIRGQGIEYWTVENFYQAMKTKDLSERAKIAKMTPKEAKRYCGKHNKAFKLREDWDQIKIDVMEWALVRKFVPGTNDYDKLMTTKGEIVEWNNWHDNFWGQCKCDRCKNIKGKNTLGKLLMKIRQIEGEKNVTDASSSNHLSIPVLHGVETNPFIFTTGNIFDSEAEAIINTINCVGVMGKGLALQFKHRYPDNFQAYAIACRKGEVRPGRMFITRAGNKYLINFPTKRHWRDNSKLEDIATGLDALKEEIKTRNIKSIAIPPLGAGLGGLNWENQVKPLIVEKLNSLTEVKIFIFGPK